MNQYEQLRPLFEKSVQMAAKTPGLKIMYGTGVDGTTYTHGSQAMDFIELVKLGGLTPARTLQAATIVNAQAFGLFNQIGSVEKGKFADIVAVPGNPLADISTMSHINFVMKGGTVIRDDTARRVAAR
jgi:imidazolonepropionase-like amidohydrolase